MSFTTARRRRPLVGRWGRSPGSRRELKHPAAGGSVRTMSASRPRVGHIQYLNCLPIYWGLMRSGALLDVDLYKDTPDRLNSALITGDLDIGPISLVEYLRHADDLLLLPNLAVGSDGPVLSVNLTSTPPLPERDGPP